MSSAPASAASNPWPTRWSKRRPTLNATVRSAAEHGLSVSLDLSHQTAHPDTEPIPVIRARISQRIV
jgi:hypothetical protein